MADLLEPPAPTDLTQKPSRMEEEGFQGGSSAKIDQLVHFLKLTPANEKSLVFSQFTSFLDKVNLPLFQLETTHFLLISRLLKHLKTKGQ